jgi:hypothetical protein
LADVAVGNALISGGLNAAPAWGKIALASAVSGTLPVANGGTGVTTSTGTGDVVLSNSPTLVTPALGTPASGNLANCTFPTLNQNTTGTAGNVTGVVAIINGGTASTTAQGAMNTLAGATTSGYYLRGNGTNVVMASIVAGDVPTLNQNTTGSSGSCTGNSATATTATTCNGNYNTTNAQQNGSDGWWRSTGSAGWYNSTYAVGIYSTGAGLVQTYNSSSFQANGALYATGNVTAYYSDERLKTNLGNVKNALDSVCKLNGFRYINNEVAKSVGYENEEVQLGVSAQEVEALFPEIVSIAPFDMLHNEETGAISSKSGEEYKTVDYARLVPVLIEAIKELKAEVDELKKAK